MADRAEAQGPSRWDGRPVLSFLIRAGVFTIPILASVIVSIWLSRVLPEPQDILGLLRWWAILLGASTASLFVVNAGARRFLPLAALMRMSMVFPDKAPGRFKTALRSGSSVKHLKAQLSEAERLGRANDVDRAAEFILQLSNSLNAHDRRTRGHAERVRAYAEMLAEEMDLPERDRAKLRWASLLHDIGKLKVSTDILNKPGRLDDDEWLEIKKHPTYGAEICAPLLEWLGDHADTIEDHHERFDGNGYPNGKKGDEISLGGRIVAVADAFDVMTTVRSYKAAMPASAAREELARNAGSQFDPAVVRAFLNVSMGRLRWVAGPLSWLAQLPFLRFVGAVQQVGTAVGVAGVAATGVAAVVGGGLVDLPGDEPLDLLPTSEQVQAAGTPTTVATAGLSNDAFTGTEDDTLVMDVLANDALRGVISIVRQPRFGTVIINEDGTVTYIPDPDFSGDDDFDYTVDDAPAATVKIRISAINDLPFAVDDVGEVDEDGSVTIAVLANDGDTEGLDFATLRVVRAPLNGTAVVNRAAGTITYTPRPDFVGTDGFTYEVADTDGEAVRANVVVTVGAVNDPPVAEPDTATVPEDGTISVDVLANDHDPDDDLATATLEVTRVPTLGTATAAGGRITYTPRRDVHGADSFRYRLCDPAGACALADVDVTITPVNDTPTLAPVPAVTTDEDVALTVDLLALAADADGDALRLTLPASTDAGGRLAASGGRVTYTPPTDYHGVDAFRFTVTDGAGGTVTATQAITVRPVNDPPLVPGPGPLTLAEDTDVSFDPLAGASDVDADALTIDSFDAVTAAGGTVVSGSLIYTPPPDFHGADSFTYTVTDGNGGTATVAVSLTVTPTNDAPAAKDDTHAIPEDTLLVLTAPGVLGNDSDVDGDPLTATVATPPAHGTLFLNGDGAVSYTPDPHWHGTDTFTYTVSDGAGGWDTATVTIEVAAVNDDPLVAADSYNAIEDIPVVRVAPGVLGNDTDADGDPLAAAVLTAPGHGNLTLNPDGSFTYTPAPNWNGTDSFSYTASDGNGGAGTGTVTITVAAVNDAPVARDDAYSTAEDGVLVLPAPGVLGNDSDVDGDTLRAVVVTPPANGALFLATDGALSYAPDPHWFGTDSFTYRAKDGAGSSATATATIEVAPVNDVPAAGDDAYATSEDAAVTTGDVTANDSDVEDGVPAGPVTVVAGPSDGTLVDHGDGTFTYTPDPNFNGTDSFTYRVDDAAGAASNVATVTITVAAVNDPPVANDDGAATPEDNVVVVDVVANDSDVEDGVPAGSVTVVAGPSDATLVDHGDGTFTYTPDPNFNGTDSFTYRVDDAAGAASNVATVTITVAAVNDPPAAGDDAFATSEDSAVTTGDVTANDSDVEDGVPAGPVTVVAGPSDGTLVDHGDGTFTYTPDPNFNGTDSFTYRVDDAAGAASNVATVTITVAAVNDPPVANDDGTTTPEDNPVVVDVVANDTDVEDGGPVPSSATATGGPGNGTLVDNGDGTFLYTPNTDWNGTDSFTYTVRDSVGALSNTATVTITVGVVNDPPVANDDAFATSEDTAVIVDVVANDTDVEDGTPDAATAARVAGPSDGIVVNNGDGTFTYTPDADFEGTDTFTYTVEDSLGATSNVATVTITVSAVNDPPVAGDDSGAGFATSEDTGFTTGDVGANDTDVEDGIPRDNYTITALPSNGTVVSNGNGTFDYAPDPNWFGSDTFTYTVDDSAGATSNTATVSITVTPVNDDPVAVDDGGAAFTTAEDTAFTTGDVTANDTDVEDGVPSGAVVKVTDPANGTVTNNGDGTFDYTPDPNWFGSDSFTYTVDDSAGATSNTATVSITVTAVNDDPVAVDDGGLPFATAEDTTLTTPDVTANDSDVEDGIPAGAVVKVTDPANGTVVNNGDGTFDYTPDPNWFGTDTFTYTVDDSAGATSNTATVTVTVLTVNDDPVANDDSGAAFSAVEDGGVVTTGDVTANDTDVEDGIPTGAVVKVTDPANGTVVNNGDGTFDYTPDPDFAGTDTFTYTVDDSNGATSNTATVSIAVSGVNDPPVLAPVADTSGDEGTPITFTASATDPQDSPPDTITYSLGGTAPAGATINASTGAFSWTPSEAQGPGVYTFDVVATDGGSPNLDDTDSVTITVNEVNQAPTATSPGDQTTGVGQPVSVYVPATDPDLPANTLTWDDAGTLPAGLSIDAATGEITGSATATGTTTVTVTVDDGSLSDSVSFDWTAVVVSTDVRFSEFRTTGPAGAADEFIELYNSGTGAQSLVGWTIQLYNGAGNPVGTPIALGTGSVTDIQPNSWYLIPGSAYSGAAAGDQAAFADNIAIGGGAALLDGGGASVDTVGSASVGTPLPRMTGTNDQSYERRHGPGYGNCVDTNADVDDFVHNMVTSNPTNSTAGPVACGTPPPPPTPVGPPHIVVSEFRTSGPGGPSDEFVELFNPTLGTIDLNGYEIRNASGSAIHRFTASTLIVAGGHYTVGGPTYGGAQDVPFSEGAALASGGSVQVWDGSTIVDVVGTSPGNPHEGRPLPPITTSGATDESYERVGSNCQDTDDNGADFYHNLASINPQTSASPATPCPSPAGDIVVNEVLFAERPLGTDEFVEIYNAGSISHNLTNWVVSDHNLLVADVDPNPLNYSIPSTDLHGTASVLAPGEYAVIWIQDHKAKEGAPFAALEYNVGPTAPPRLDATGDDVYIFAPGLVPVDYMRWGAGGELNTPALAWDGSHDAINAASVSPGVSLALTPDTVDADLSACWEPTDSGDAGGRAPCSGAPSTHQHDLDLRLASPGVDNNTPYPKSSRYGQVAINEIFAVNSGDQFVELANAAGGPIDISGWTVADGNLRIDELDGGGSSFDFTFPASTTLPAGGHAVIWVQNPGPATQASPFADLEFWAGDNSSAVKDSADEMWLYDPALNVVDFVAWGSGGDVTKGEAPDPVADFWDASNQAALGAPPANHSLSLTADGVDTDDSACWEFTATGTSACGPATVDNDDWPARVASPGDDNNVATADLEVTVSVDDARPNNGSSVAYTVTVTNHSQSNGVNGVEVTDLLPAGVGYTGDDGGGAYVPATGVWTVGTVGANSSTALVIDATVTAAEGAGVDNTATLTAAGTPDPDPANGSDTASLTVNRSPVAGDDSASDFQDSPMVVAVLGNDSEPDGDPITLTVDSGPTAKGFYDCAGTTCLYWPDAGETGADSFTYQITDDRGLPATATVNITLVPTSHPTLFLKTDGTTSDSVLLPLGVPPASPTSMAAPPVPDWNDGGDGKQGLTLKRADGGDEFDEDSDSRYQAWNYAVGGSDLVVNGPVKLRLWTAALDFSTTQGGILLARLADCTNLTRASNSPQCTAVSEVTVSVTPWAASGTFERKIIDFGNVVHTFPSGKHLRIKLVVSESSPDDLMIAFDTNATPSYVIFE